jgi:hypothetical protein
MSELKQIKKLMVTFKKDALFSVNAIQLQENKNTALRPVHNSSQAP